MTNPRWNPEEFLSEILYQLGHEEELSARAQIVHRLHEVLFENFEAGKNTLVLIDEGQLMQDQAVLEELRLVLNYQLNDAFLVSLLIVGQPNLGQQIRDFPPLDQRVVTHGHLKSLSVEEVREYVEHRLGVAGRKDPLFTEGAIELVDQYSEGIPRKVNNICDIALVVGFSRKLEHIDADWIKRLIGTSHLHPTRPKVEILLDSRGRSLKPPRQLVLEEEPMVYIVNPAIEEDILKKNNAREGMHAR